MRRSLTAVYLCTVLAVVVMAGTLFVVSSWQSAASPGPLSEGHAKLTCDECHTSWNTGPQRLNFACLDCHREEVGKSRNAHSPAYFEIVGTRETPWYLSPTECVDCHRGHKSERDTHVMSYIPTGYCVACHDDVQQRVRAPEFVTDHKAFDFSTCQSCHQFHERTLFAPAPHGS